MLRCVTILWSFCSSGEEDVIDESLYFFKANVFFKSYEVKVQLV